MTWDEELDLVKPIASEFGLQWQAVAAIRKTENGSPGREFGVLSVAAPTYEDQLRETCVSLRNQLVAFRAAPLAGYHRQPDGQLVLAYSEGFIQAFARRWAPMGVANDPNQLNANWVANFTHFYHEFLDGDPKEAKS